MMRRPQRIAFVVAASLTLMASAGCSRDMSDLKTYVERVKAQKSTKIEPLPEIRTFETFAYVPDARREPFRPAKDEEAEEIQRPVSDLRPDANRPRQPLEQFPVGGLNMLGTLEYGGRTYALIRSPDGIVHRATVGEYAGQNYGKIINITDTQVALVEIVPDGFGGYAKRPTTIALSEQ